MIDTRNKEEVLKKFFRLNAENTFIRLAIHKYCRIGYSGMDALNGINRDVSLRAEQEGIEQEYDEFIHTNGVVDILEACDLDEESRKPQYKFSTEEQYKYSKRVLGIKVCIDDLMED